MIGDEAGAGCPGCFAPDTASDDETLGLVVVDALLPMPPATIRYWGRCARMLCSGYRQWAYCIKRILLGPVYVDALLLIPPVTLDHIE